MDTSRVKAGTKIKITECSEGYRKYLKVGDIGVIDTTSIFHAPGEIKDKHGRYWVNTKHPDYPRICILLHTKFKVLKY